MELHVALETGAPLRAQLERQLREGIRSGRLRAEARLPPSRELARELGVSRGVVVDAYSQLVAEGYLVARRGSGTEVAGLIGAQPAPSPPRVRREPAIRHDLHSGLPDVSCFPRREWQAASATALRELPDAWLTYGRPRGYSRLRVALADYLGRARATVASPQQIVICAGLSHGLTVVWGALRKRGARRVAVEDPAWRGQPDSVTYAGLEAVPIPVDAGGLVVSELERADVDAVVVTPAHQYPTGVVLSPERRGALIDWARRRRALIVEDDYDAEYRYDREPVAALQGLAPDLVVHTGTASKTLAPALRLAWLMVPDHLIDDVTAQHQLTMAMPSVIEQGALAVMLERGELERHLRQMRRRYRPRRDALAEALAGELPEAHVGGASAGLHLVAWLPPDADERAIRRLARERGVAIHTLEQDSVSVAPVPPALLLGYASLTEEALRRAARELAIAVRSDLYG
ncbi:MAG: PLP-dependent aminotransferase family protein [Actinomycetota bacterium]|nr:PLP-dependent aminotransferase family protein [Actinomycetota bacterium]